MIASQAEPAVFDPAPSHPEELRSEFELRIGRHISLQGRARLTPAGLICAGLSVAVITLSLAYLAGRVGREMVPQRRRRARPPRWLA
jgi:hypothetical protein